MPSIADGTYRIYNAGTSYLLDVLGNGSAQGTNVQVYNAVSITNDAQVFVVSTRSTGTRRITNRLSGKNLDVDNATAAVGTNVQIWRETDPNWAGQALELTATGNTKTINGTTYDTYYIAMESAPSYTFDIAGTSSGSNVILRSKTSPKITKSNEWVFVPVPMFEDGGIYEIRPMLDPKNLALDIRAANPANGANLQIYGVNHTNAQKFFITEEETGKYSIRCLHSGKYIDVSAAQAANNVNVQAWEDNDTRAQRWNMMTYGTKVIDGMTCQIVRFGSYVTNDGTTYMMDVSAAQTAWQTNVQIYSYNNTDAQLFVLYPTDGEDPTMPVPYDIGVTEAIGGTPSQYSESSTFNIGWKCAKSWAGDGTNHYEMRSRKRYMSPASSSWKDWSAFGAWEEAPAAMDGINAYITDPYTDNYAWADAKNCEYEFQVRAAAADEDYKAIHGNYVDAIINVYKKPTISLTQAAWSPDGLVLAMSSDYTYGTAYANIDHIEGGGKVMFDGTAAIEANAATGSGVIENDDMLLFPTNGQTITVKFRPGYDQHSAFAAVQTATLTVNYDAGTISVTPTFVRQGNKLIAVVAHLGTEQVWVPFKNRLYKCEIDESYTAPAGYVAFNVLYPMGTDFDVFTEAHNAARTQWGTDMSSLDEINIQAHAFDWDGKSLFITKFDEGGETYGESGEASYTSDVLDARQYETVSFGNTMKKTITVSGIIPKDEGSTADIEAMVGNHVTYRSPDGGIYDVAVLDYSATVHKQYIEVSLTLKEETR